MSKFGTQSRRRDKSGVAEEVRDQDALNDALQSGGGPIFINIDGTSDLDAAITITGEDSTSAHKHFEIYSRGVGHTTLQAANGSNVFYLEDAASVNIHDMTLNGGTTAGDDVIYGDDGGTTELSAYHSNFGNLKFNVKAADAWGMHLENMARYTFYGNLMFQCDVAATSNDNVGAYDGTPTGQGGGIFLHCTDDGDSWNDGTWAGYVQIRLNANNLTGIKLQGNDVGVDHYVSVCSVPGLVVITENGARTGLMGLDADYCNNWHFEALQFENLDYGLRLDECSGLNLKSPFASVTGAGGAVMWDIRNTCARITFRDWKKITMTNGTLVLDAVAAEQTRTKFYNCHHNNAAVTLTTTAATYFDSCYLDAAYSQKYGTGSITGGGTTDVIAHGLFGTPARIKITLTENPTNDPGNIWVDTIGAANFTVNCRNDPGVSNLDFKWEAYVSTA